MWGGKKPQKTCFKAQLKVSYNQAFAFTLACWAAWDDASGMPGPHPIRIVKILMDSHLARHCTEYFSSSGCTGWSVTLRKERRGE